jgi:hypothetical protein
MAAPAFQSAVLVLVLAVLAMTKAEEGACGAPAGSPSIPHADALND